MRTLYSKDGDEIKCSEDQVQYLLDRGVWSESPPPKKRKPREQSTSEPSTGQDQPE